MIGITGDKFIAIYKTPDKMCVYEQPASGVSDSKAHLGKSGKELKEAWPELELSPSAFVAVIVTDSQGGHNILFLGPNPPTTPPPRHRKKRSAIMMSTLGGAPYGNIIFDVDKKKVVSKEATPYVDTMSVSSKEPMTMYQAQLGDKSSFIIKVMFYGKSVSNT